MTSRIKMVFIKIALSDIKKAHERISPYIHFTPYFTSSTLDSIVGRNVFFKAENLQKTGSFKARGALNAASIVLNRTLLRFFGLNILHTDFEINIFFVLKVMP